LDVRTAEVALPEDATCIHHPRKKATTVCAGTGDYICSLCAVELHGQTYSAQYLATAGKALASKAFDRYLPRPDSRVALALLLLFIPGLNYLFFLWIPYGFYNLVQAWRLRKQDDLFRRLVGSGRLVWLGILLSLISLVLAVIAVAVIIAIINRQP
jgi:hypothetical protein